MNITTERIPDSQVLLTIEIDADRVEQSMDQAYRRVAPKVRVPGFRPGKAPRSVLERHVGRTALLQEALDKLVPQVVEEAIKEQDLQMVDQPDLEITSLEPVIVKATVPVRPTIDLGAYRDIRLDPDPVEVEESAVDEMIESLRQRYADIEPVDRPVAGGDRVRVNLTGHVEDRRVLNQEDAELQITADMLEATPGVYERILGMAKGDTATFEVELPEDYRRSELAGKPITYHLEVLDVKGVSLPEVTDEWAQEVGEGFESVEALRERIRTDRRNRAEQEATTAYQGKLVDALVAGATLEFPPQLVEREAEHMLREITSPSGLSGAEERRYLDRILQAVGRTQDEMKEELRPGAAERVRRTLVLSKLAEIEQINVIPDEIEAELEAMTGGQQSAQLRQVFDTPSGREVIERQVRSRKTMERLTAIAKGEAPPLPEPAPEPDATEAETPEAAETEA